LEESRVLRAAERPELASTGSSPGELALLAVAVRWAGVAMATMAVVGHEQRSGSAEGRLEALAVAGLVVYGIVRTARPAGTGTGARVVVPLVAETVVLEALAAATGGWSSPLLLQIGAVVLIAGLVGGLVATEAVVGSIAVVAAFVALSGVAPSRPGDVPSVIAELVVVAGLGVFARRLVLGRSGYLSDEIERLRQAGELNGVLLELYARALGDPGSLGVEGSVGDVVSALRDAFAPDALGLLLASKPAQSGEQAWEVVAGSGLDELGLEPDGERLPRLLAEAARSKGAVVAEQPDGGQGRAGAGGSVLAVALQARGRTVGLVVLARYPEAPAFRGADAETLGLLARHAALALDNGRWIDRLRQLGADAERDRIARDLHDRVGQSLAAVSLGLDRLVALVREDASLTGLSRLSTELEEAAGEVRGVLREVRETLSELRSGPGEGRRLAAACSELCERVRRRSAVSTRCNVHGVAEDLGPGAERELWWIIHEAVVNAERHAKASTIEVALALGPEELLASVTDDGIGIGSLESRQDAFGVRGMRERAELLGATLGIAPVPSGGTRVEVRVPRRWP